MTTQTKVVLVTGSNKGIGLEIVRELCWLFDGDVILTARNEQRGMEAMKTLQAEGLNPKFLQLDITSAESIETAKRYLLANYGHLDVLINNAGVCLTSNMGIPLAERAVTNMNTNYYGIVNSTRAFLPLMQPNGRVAIMGSESAHMLGLVSPELQLKFQSPALTFEELSQLMDDYVEAAKAGDTVSRGWPAPDADDDSYSIAEVGRILFTELLAKEYASDPTNNMDIVGVIPGWVRTEMGGPEANDSLPAGAASSVFAALLPPGRSRYHGKFVNKEKVFITWERIKRSHDRHYLTKAQL